MGHLAPARLGRLLLVGLTALGWGCAAGPPPQTFDSNVHLREQIAARVGEERAATIQIPWELDEEIVAATVGRLNWAQSERRRVDNVLEFVFGWLELDYNLMPTRSAVETFRARKGNCLSFVNLFVGVARHVRLNPFYVEVENYQRWNYQQGFVISHGHIVAGLYIDGEMSTFDFLPYRAKSYRDFEPIDELKATAHYYNNLGAEALLEGNLEVAGKDLEIAVALEPGFAKATNNLGVYYMRLGEDAKALKLYLEALEGAPDDVALLSNTARAHQQLGHQDEADELIARLEALDYSNPFFYVYRGEVALAHGDVQAALDYMRRALKRDADVPEVHVGFVKVYLAMGDMDKARHHLERALKLDATHREARRYAAMLTAGASEGR